MNLAVVIQPSTDWKLLSQRHCRVYKQSHGIETTPFSHSALPMLEPVVSSYLAQCELDICEVVHKPKVQALLMEALCLIKGLWAFCEFCCLFLWVFVSFQPLTV